ncbi:hypothetical protein like AT4G21215 [Hibiscus trionum]|uniref:Uncharacterized protein n=1 Tax=Hibiscus trionum TaxID=183268 RepID=A0A9W7IDR4_HIBTR|nr:hypothetical protein like AT4G21215 [Hibiscus trionum]
MVEMKENPKLDLPSSYNDCGSEEKIKSPENKPDSFIIDMESFMHGIPNKENNPNSRFPRSLSRKGSQRGDKKNVNISNSTNSIANDHRDSLVSSSSSHGGTPEKLTAVAEVSGNHPGNNPQTHHQITFASGNISAANESGLLSLRRNSFKRSSPPWMLDPKRILMFFATLSSMGTILLIYFTLSIGRTNPDRNALD